MKAASAIFGNNSLYGKTPSKEKDTLDFICDQIRKQKLLPIISNNVTDELLFGSHEEVVEKWAQMVEYPFPDRDNFPRISQYADITESARQGADAQRQDATFIKTTYLNDFLKPYLASRADPDLLEEMQEENSENDIVDMPFTQFAQLLEMPNISDEQPNTLSILTELRLPVYVTTSYHMFMEKALEKVGRKPVTGVSFWHGNLKDSYDPFKDGSYVPSAEEPLVYHLFGVESNPGSMVISEDDHLDFLVGMSRDWQWAEGIPGCVRQALADSSLLLLGYNLWDWDFRVLLRGLIKGKLNEKSPQSVSIQLRENDKVRAYFEQYLKKEVQFKAYWKSTTELMNEIYTRWSESA